MCVCVYVYIYVEMDIAICLCVCIYTLMYTLTGATDFVSLLKPYFVENALISTCRKQS